jgi:hypothetical protein
MAQALGNLFGGGSKSTATAVPSADSGMYI